MNSLIIKIDGTDTVYECHSYAQGASIIASVYTFATQNGYTIEGWDFV